jgi:hypothetical protein
MSFTAMIAMKNDIEIQDLANVMMTRVRVGVGGKHSAYPCNALIAGWLPGWRPERLECCDCLFVMSLYLMCWE